MKKILIVDDSRAMQTIVRRGIEQLGYDDIKTQQASSAAEALDIIRTWEPDLVLCDWHMPGMSGLELLYSLNRQMLPTQVGFVTTESTEERKQQALSAGAKFFVQKPFDTKTLHAAVLPLIQGSSDGEAALVESGQKDQTEKNQQKENITLPDVRSLNNIIQHFCKVNIAVTKSPPLSLSDKNFPCLLGLLEDVENEKIRAVIIFNLQATCILGGAITAIQEDKVLKAIFEKAIPKAMITNCTKLAEGISVAIFDDKLLPMKLRSANVIRKKLDSIEKLLRKPSEERIDVAVKTAEYGEGKLTIITS